MKKSQQLAPLQLNEQLIAVFSDFTANVAKASLEFTEVKKLY